VLEPQEQCDQKSLDVNKLLPIKKSTIRCSARLFKIQKVKPLAKKVKPAPKRKTTKYKCKLCGILMLTRFQLGGHMSRGHPGKSEVYRLKLVTRAKREVERNFLQQAKNLFFQ
jgi:hypothetical protein